MRQGEGAGEEGVLFNKLSWNFSCFRHGSVVCGKLSASAMVLAQVREVWKATNTLLKLLRSMW